MTSQRYSVIMRLYQYTTIDALSLILKNQTIRFSRLDTVDDPDEYQIEKDGINPSRYVFLSCWSKVSEESVPMWRMYSSNGSGVRIGLDSEMFEVVYSGKYPYFFSLDYFYDKDYIMTPLMRAQQFKYPLYDVEYVKSTKSQLDKIYKENEYGVALDFKELAKYKSVDWQFQNEVRFVINMLPKQRNKDRVYNFHTSIPNGILIEERFVDIPIRQEVFQNMDIMVGPKVSEAGINIVESLMFHYLGRKDLHFSKFML